MVLVDGDEYGARTLNLSLGGLFVLMEPVPAIGQLVKIRVKFPALENESLLEAVVRWHGDGGAGMQFGSLRAIDVWAINQLMD